MKRILLFVALISIGPVANAQVLNGAFESWDNTNYESSSDWFGSNGWSTSMFGVPNVTQDTAAQSGSFGIRLETMIQGNDTAFAYIANTPGDPTAGQGGTPFSQQPTTVDGYYKSDIMTGDTAILIVSFKLGGVVLTTDFFIFTGTQSTYMPFSFTLTPPGMNPDTIIVAAASSNALNNLGVQDGSWLALDSLWFGGATQGVPDNGFENWFTADWNDPTDWLTQNIYIDQSAVNDMAEQSTDAYKGNYSLEVNTTWDVSSTWINSVVSNGWEGDTMTLGGAAFTNQVDTLQGWYKYSPQGSDTAVIYMDFYQGSTTNPPYYGIGTWLYATPNWTQFQVPFDAGSPPDTVRISISSSAWPPAPINVGSQLTIDEIEMASAPLFTAVEPLSWTHAMKIYPNPSNGMFTVERFNADRPMNVTVLDAFGKQVYATQFNNRRAQLDLQGMAAGVYILQMNDGIKISKRKVIIQ